MVGNKCYGYVVKNEIEKVDINSRIDYEFSKFLVKDENKNFRHVGIVTTNLKILLIFIRII